MTTAKPPLLGVAAELLVDDAPTCGIGVAQHAAIPAKLATMFEASAGARNPKVPGPEESPGTLSGVG